MPESFCYHKFVLDFCKSGFRYWYKEVRLWQNVQYVEKEKACPMEVKQNIEEMYRLYVRDGKRNHVAADYLDRLMALPVKGDRH